ncbi:hypothetical protein JW877_01360 [bacterium]|nr:hypothetical protein [bacterium]
MGSIKKYNSIYIVVLTLILLFSFACGTGSKENDNLDAKTAKGEAGNNPYTCGVYFGSIGCHNCEGVAGIMVKELFEQYPRLVLVVYELEGYSENAEAIGVYNSKYRAGFMIPVLIFNSTNKNAGGDVLERKVRDMVAVAEGNECPLPDGSIPFSKLDINSLPGYPQIWMKDRLLMKTGKEEVDSKVLHNLMTAESIEDYIKTIKTESYSPENNQLVHNLAYRNAIRIGGWIFQWGPYFESE